MSIGVGGQHHLGTALEHLGADLVRVADDELRAIPRLAQHVRAGAHTNQHRLVLLDERLEGLQVIGSAGFVGDDHHVPTPQIDVDIGNPDAVDQ